ncbi:hypothetical protein ACHAPO_009884 [Fusarium lateritium]
MAQNNGFVDFDDEGEFTFPDDGKRTEVVHPGKDQYKFRPNDAVTVQGDPVIYLVEKTQDGKYSLCDKDAKAAYDGKLFQESELKLYNPFESAS